MNKVRCTICRHQLPNLNKLKCHYVFKHSKIQIIRQVMKASILNATPSVLNKAKKRRCISKTIYLHDKLEITYSSDGIVIKNASNVDNLIELTFDEIQNYSFSTTEKITEKKLRRKCKKAKKLFHIDIKKIEEVPKSLHEFTGEFYECHCMKKKQQKLYSDTDSGSDSGTPFYCSFCGNGYQTTNELTQHENLHQYYCKFCNKVFSFSNHRDHIEQHIHRIYVCHFCGFESNCKEILIKHFELHAEQQIFEDILDMERDYNLGGFYGNFTSGNYYTNINNIMSFLNYPYDHYYSRNIFMKVVCCVCHQEIYLSDFERHLKMAHFLP